MGEILPRNNNLEWLMAKIWKKGLIKSKGIIKFKKEFRSPSPGNGPSFLMSTLEFW